MNDNITKQVKEILEDSGAKAVITNVDNMEADTRLLYFDMWQDALLAGTIPDPKRFTDQVTKHLDCKVNSQYYFMFMGFCGAFDLLEAVEKKEAEIKAE